MPPTLPSAAVRRQRQLRNTGVLAALVCGVGLAAWAAHRPTAHKPVSTSRGNSRPRAVTFGIAPTTIAARIVAAARAQIGTIYDPSYVVLTYPGGDVPRGRGACTDVVIRALRAAGYDLQRLVHEDMRAHFGVYPRKWGLRRPDRNIDHRRVPNLVVFFRRHGRELTRSVDQRTLPQWQPGDIVCWVLPTGQDHIGIVSDRTNASGTPLAIHNLSICAEEDVLTAWRIQGHFRYSPGSR